MRKDLKKKVGKDTPDSSLVTKVKQIRGDFIEEQKKLKEVTNVYLLSKLDEQIDRTLVQLEKTDICEMEAQDLSAHLVKLYDSKKKQQGGPETANQVNVFNVSEEELAQYFRPKKNDSHDDSCKGKVEDQGDAINAS